MSIPVQVPKAASPPKTTNAVPEKPVLKQVNGTQYVKWRYEKKVNQDGQTTVKASITSPAILQFGFPYTGGSTVTLTLRKRDKTTTVYLQVANGQFNRSFQGGSVRIRFDGEPAVTYAYSAAENGSATVIFFDEADKFIRQIKTAKKTVITVSFYAQGNRQIEFRTAGLEWPHS